MAAFSQNPRNIFEKTPAGDVCEAFDLPLLDAREEFADIDARGFEQEVAERSSAFGGKLLVEIPVALSDDPADQRKAVAMNAGTGKAEDEVAGSDSRPGQD